MAGDCTSRSNATARQHHQCSVSPAQACPTTPRALANPQSVSGLLGLPDELLEYVFDFASPPCHLPIVCARLRHLLRGRQEAWEVWGGSLAEALARLTEWNALRILKIKCISVAAKEAECLAALSGLPSLTALALDLNGSCDNVMGLAGAKALSTLKAAPALTYLALDLSLCAIGPRCGTLQLLLPRPPPPLPPLNSPLPLHSPSRGWGCGGVNGHLPYKSKVPKAPKKVLPLATMMLRWKGQVWFLGNSPPPPSFGGHKSFVQEPLD